MQSLLRYPAVARCNCLAAFLCHKDPVYLPSWDSTRLHQPQSFYSPSHSTSVAIMADSSWRDERRAPRPSGRASATQFPARPAAIPMHSKPFISQHPISKSPQPKLTIPQYAADSPLLSLWSPHIQYEGGNIKAFPTVILARLRQFDLRWPNTLIAGIRKANKKNKDSLT